MNAPRTDLNVFVTGANGGLGLATCHHLVRDGATRLVLACRTEAKAEESRAHLLSLEAAAGPALESVGGFDMNDPDAIRSAVAKLPGSQPFDTVFLQAGGVVYGDSWRTVDYAGHPVERTVFQNAVGPLVTLEALRCRGLLAPHARVVIAGGEGARGIPGMIAKPSFASWAELRAYVRVEDIGAKYVEMDAMGVSKFVSALWTMEAATRYRDEMEVIWFTPGLTAGTRGLQGVGRVKQLVFERLGFPLMVRFGRAQTVDQGGRKFADCLQRRIGESGDLIGAPEGGALGELQDQKPMNAAFDDLSLRTGLWEFLSGIVHV